MDKKNILLVLSCVFLSVGITGCVAMSPAKPPLPAVINIIPPSPDLPPEIAAFSGVWEGKWGAVQDTVIVIEKIDAKTAEVLISFGEAERTGIRPQNIYHYQTAAVLPGPIIQWKISNRDSRDDCPCTVTLKLNKELNRLTAFFTFERIKSKWRADLTRSTTEKVLQ
ncbi:MAG: hypothetical protein GXP46_11170 [Deferribacteres bacterium]|nr:hypothetical protein [Deferribacteres bacterium]